MTPPPETQQTTFEQVWPMRALFCRAFEAYLKEPSKENAVAVGQTIQDAVEESPEPMVAPTLALFEVMVERGRVVPQEGMSLHMTTLRNAISPVGWNDYWMCRWELARDPAAVAEIHRRVTHGDPDTLPMVTLTAVWMSESVGRQNPEFAVAMAEAKAACMTCAGTEGKVQ